MKSKSFRCNTYEKQGEGGQLLLTRHATKLLYSEEPSDEGSSCPPDRSRLGKLFASGNTQQRPEPGMDSLTSNLKLRIKNSLRSPAQRHWPVHRMHHRRARP